MRGNAQGVGMDLVGGWERFGLVLRLFCNQSTAIQKTSGSTSGSGGAKATDHVPNRMLQMGPVNTAPP